MYNSFNNILLEMENNNDMLHQLSSQEWRNPTSNLQAPQNDFDSIFSSPPTPVYSEPSNPPIDRKPETPPQQGGKTKNPKKKDTQKNIPAYVGCKAVHAFIGRNYKRIIASLCRRHSITLEEAQEVYQPYQQYSFIGLSLLHSLICPSSEMTEREERARLVFRAFYQWYLRKVYVRYLLVNGKMCEKEKYILVKNRTLLSLGDHSEEDIPSNSISNRSN